MITKLLLAAALWPGPHWHEHRASLIANALWSKPSWCKTITLYADPNVPPLLAEASGWATPGVCAVHIVPYGYLLDWRPFAQTYTHERGHIVGRHHVFTPPTAIMYPTPFFTKSPGQHWVGANWRFRDRGVPYLNKHVPFWRFKK